MQPVDREIMFKSIKKAEKEMFKQKPFQTFVKSRANFNPENINKFLSNKDEDDSPSVTYRYYKSKRVPIDGPNIVD